MHVRVLGLSGALGGLLLSFGLLVRTAGRPARAPGVGPEPGAADAGADASATAPDPLPASTQDGTGQGEEDLARELFFLLDQDGDGLLAEDEMPPALRARLRRWDADGD